MKVTPRHPNIKTPRLADMTSDPKLKRFFRSGEAGGSIAALPAPTKPVAPAACEAEVV